MCEANFASPGRCGTRVMLADEAGIAEAARLLRCGAPVALPTETVYGLAANALDNAAVEQIFAAKGRPQDNPLIAHIASFDELAALVTDIPPAADALARAFWPGPLTMVLPSSGRAAAAVQAGLSTIAVRMPANDAARAVIRAAGVPLAMPSANVSGSPSPTTAAHVLADLAGKIPLIIDDGNTAIGIESTVVSLVGAPVVLRPGFITPEELAEVLGVPVELSPSVEKPLAEGEAAASPGMKYRHYAPQAKLTILEGTFAQFATHLARAARENEGGQMCALCFAGEEALLPVPAVAYGVAGDAPSQAAGLYAALRRLDEMGAELGFARCPEKTGVGLAVYNRLLRAASFRVKVL